VILAALLVFRLAGESVSPAAEAGLPRAVGSLQKPWVVAAWGEAHPGEAPPRLECTAGSRCWLPAGHGRVDLARGMAHSCNTYFLALARATPEPLRAEALARAGFSVRRPLSPEASIGLGPLDALPRIAPSALLRSYRELLRRPWPSRDDLRLAVLDGMRAAAQSGTGAALGARGRLVKTGTVPALDGRPLATSGWALAATPGGESLALALLPNGTGARAAELLGGQLAPAGDRARARSARSVRRLPAHVRVRLLSTLRPESIRVTNAGAGPVRLRRRGERETWLGPGAGVEAEPGLQAGPGLLRLDVAPHRLARFYEGTLELSGRKGAPRVVLSTSVRDWVDGVLRGELGGRTPELREELAGAALRFLGAGPRHGAEHLCDTTHCAVFAGRGPAVAWVTPRRAELLAGERLAAASPFLDDAAWARALDLAARPGPEHFTGHCGGAPLSPRAVWGRGAREAASCPRHSPADAEAWERLLPVEALASAFGSPVVELRAEIVDGVRRTRATTRERSDGLLYDDLHRLLAPSLGWDALPSPPDSFERVGGGWLARGRGRGHRVGLCLGAGSR
jgi:stage II sporulation protein D